MEKTERSPEVYVKKLHRGRSEAFVAGHPSYSGKACKEMKRVVCLETSNSAILCLESWAHKTWKRHVLPSSVSSSCHNPPTNDRAAGFIASSTEFKQDEQHTPRCEHSFEVWRREKSFHHCAFLRSLCGSWAVCVVSQEQGAVQTALVTACVQTLCSPL